MLDTDHVSLPLSTTEIIRSIDPLLAPGILVKGFSVVRFPPLSTLSRPISIFQIRTSPLNKVERMLLVLTNRRIVR